MVRKGNASNPISHQKWQLNSSAEINKLKRSLFEKLPDTKLAFNKNESAAANMANLGLVYKLDDKQRSLVNYKTQLKVNEKKDVPPPKPFNLQVPESLGKRTEPVMMHEWDYDYCGPLVKVYGTNYKAMSRDLKRNYRQKSEGELRRLCERYVEFATFGESKLQELEKLEKEEEAKERQGTILGAPEAIVDATKTNTTTTTNDNTTKRKRADEAADGKKEENKDTTKKTKENTKKEETTKQTPAKKANTKEVETPAKKAKKEVETPAKKETPAAKKGKKEEIETPAKKAKKEVETPAKKVTPTTPKATTKTQPETKLATKTTETKSQKKVEPKKTEKKVDNKKGKQEEEDSDMDGMEFDFNEDDLSSDDE